MLSLSCFQPHAQVWLCQRAISGATTAAFSSLFISTPLWERAQCAAAGPCFLIFHCVLAEPVGRWDLYCPFLHSLVIPIPSLKAPTNVTDTFSSFPIRIAQSWIQPGLSQRSCNLFDYRLERDKGIYCLSFTSQVSSTENNVSINQMGAPRLTCRVTKCKLWVGYSRRKWDTEEGHGRMSRI